MTRRLYVARDKQVTVIARGRLRLAGGRHVRRPWTALVETQPAGTLEPEPRRSIADAAIVTLPPVLTGSAVAAFAPLEAGIAVGSAIFFAMSYLTPILRRRSAARGPRAAGSTEVRTLTAAAERVAFHQAMETADRVSETWPALGVLVDVPEAEQLLAEALWEIATVLARREELTAVLAELTHPHFSSAPPEGVSPDLTSRDLTSQIRAIKAALSDLEIDLARREAGLRRAEEAGRSFIREQAMRRAIRTAEDSLRTPAPGTPLDPGAELAAQTSSVLAAYRELTATFKPR